MPALQSLRTAHELAETLLYWRNKISMEGHMAETSVTLGSRAETLAEEFLRLEAEIDPFEGSTKV